MTVFVNGRFLVQRRSGMQRWAEEVLTALDARLNTGPERSFEPLVVLRPRGVARTPAWSRIQVRQVGGASGHLWEQTDLLRASRGGLLLNLLSSGPLLHSNQITTQHDIAVFRMPELFSGSYRLFHTLLRPLLARRSKAVVTVSEFSASELVSRFGLERAEISVIPNAGDHIAMIAPRSEYLATHGLEPRGYILCVGNQTPNKNVATAIAAVGRMNRPGLRLVLVGAGAAEVFGDLKLSDHPAVFKAGYIDDGQLRALYENAGLLCFPSRYEGFGVPVVEAMTLGCPVVASNIAAIAEVAGDAAILLPPDDVEGFATAMAQVLDDGDLRAGMRARGFARAANYAWERSAGALEDLLDRLGGGA